MQFGWGTYQFCRRSVRSRPVWPRSRQCPFRTRAWPARPRSCWDAAADDIHFQNRHRCSSSTHPERAVCFCQPLPSTTITGGTQNQSHLAQTSSKAWTTKIQATWISSSWFYAFWPIWQLPWENIVNTNFNNIEWWNWKECAAADNEWFCAVAPYQISSPAHRLQTPHIILWTRGHGKLRLSGR